MAKEKDTLTLYVERPAWQKMQAYVDLCDSEISGLGRVRKERGSYVVEEVAVLEQEVSGAHATMEAPALAKFQSERVKSGESMKNWVFWWHSHVNMAAYFSGIDTGTMDTSTEFPFLISLVMNKRGDKEARIDIHNPVRLMKEMDVVVLDEKSDSIIEECRKDIAEKIKKPYYPAGYRSGDSRSAAYDEGEYDWDGHAYVRRHDPNSGKLLKEKNDKTIEKINESTPDFEDENARFIEDFWVEIKILIDQCEWLNNRSGKKARKALLKRRGELADLVAWGQDSGIVISDGVLQSVLKATGSLSDEYAAD